MSQVGRAQVAMGPDVRHPRHQPRGGPKIPVRTRWTPPTPVDEPDTTETEKDDKENAEMTSTQTQHTLTDWERTAITEYETDIAGIPECFDCIEDCTDLDELKALTPGPLDSWWTAIDSLDSSFGPRNNASLDARNYLRAAMNEFFTNRQKALIAVATSVGIRVPQPDHFDSSGCVATSNQFCGHFGYTDFDQEHVL